MTWLISRLAGRHPARLGRRQQVEGKDMHEEIIEGDAVNVGLKVRS
jgi:hypothetical protein